MEVLMTEDLEPIVIGSKTFEIPTGYRHVKWNEVEIHSTVYIVGVSDSEPHAYGPFVVCDVEKRTLRNVVTDRVFYEQCESLLVRV